MRVTRFKHLVIIFSKMKYKPPGRTFMPVMIAIMLFLPENVIGTSRNRVKKTKKKKKKKKPNKTQQQK